MMRLAALSLICGLVALSSGTGQERKPAPAYPTIAPLAPVKLQRAAYAVKNADPVTLAEVVGKHFKGEATLLAAPAGSGNAVLISGTPGTVPEVVKLLEELDRKPRRVEVEVTIAEVPVKDWKESELKLDELSKMGQRIKLTAVEGQQVSSQSGGSKPIVSNINVGGFGGRGGGGGAVQKSVSYIDVGTTVKMVARVGSDDAVAIELSVQDRRVRPAEAGDEAAAAATETHSLTTKVSVPAGRSVVAQAIRTEGKSGATIAVVVVTARVVPDTVPTSR